MKNREGFNDHLKSKGKFEKPSEYLSELIDWVNDRISIWQSGVGDSLLKGSEKKVVSAFGKMKHQVFKKGRTIIQNLIIIVEGAGIVYNI